MSYRFETLIRVVAGISVSFGAFPLAEVGVMNYRFSWIRYLYSIFLGVISCSIGVYWVCLNITDYTLTAPFILDMVVVLFNGSTWAVMLATCYFQRESTSDIIAQLYKIHNRIGAASYSGWYLVAILLVSVFNAAPTLVILLRNPLSFFEILPMLIYYIFLNFSAIMAGRYAVLMSILSDQLASLTNQMRLSKFNLEVRNLVDIRHSLDSVAAHINNTFDLFLLLTLTLPFIVTVTNVYIAIVCVVKPGAFLDKMRLGTAIVDALVNSYNMIVVVAAASRANKNAMAFQEQLFNNMLTSKSLGKDDYLATYISMKHSLKQTACGFFTLDYSLLTSMVAGGVTYVVLLVQFTLLE